MVKQYNLKKIIDKCDIETKKELNYLSKKLKEVEEHISALTDLGYRQELEGARKTKRELLNRWLELKGCK